MTSKGKREQQQQQICDETKTLNIVLPKLDIPLDTETIDLSAAVTPGEKSSSGLGPLLFPSIGVAGSSEQVPNDGGAAACSMTTSSTLTPPPTMSFNSLAASTSSGTNNPFNPFGGGTTATATATAMLERSQSSQQQPSQQQQQPELAGKDCEVR